VKSPGCVWVVAALAALAALGTMFAAAAPASDLQPELRALLSREFKFSPSDLADLDRGKVVARRLAAAALGEVAAVGVVRVKARKESFVDRYRDIVQFKRGADVMQIGRFSDPPSRHDLEALTVDKQDADLRTCRVGSCDIRLPAATILRFQKEINWQARDADARAAALFKEVLFDDVRAYMSGSPGRITEYDDEKRPVRPVDDLAGLLKASPYVEQLVPGLLAHLETFPANRLPGSEDFVYWSKEKFGSLTPFITVTHVTITRPTPGRYVLASKDVYSSRYFDASLTLTIASDAVAAPDAFYLVYVNRSRADALKGAFAGLRRAIVERRAKSSLEENLKITKARLERNF
jgi:hypothetical protein